MQRTQFGDMHCSIARTMHIAGEPWSLLIVRNAMVGTTRFEDHQRMLGISRKVLTERLNWLVEHGIFERRQYSERPPRDDYVLTQKGRELADILFAISAWGDRWTAGEAGPPALFRHRTCGELTHAEIRCAHCGEPLHSQDIEVTAGPGADPALLAG